MQKKLNIYFISILFTALLISFIFAYHRINTKIQYNNIKTFYKNIDDVWFSSLSSQFNSSIEFINNELESGSVEKKTKKTLIQEKSDLVSDLHYLDEQFHISFKAKEMMFISFYVENIKQIDSTLDFLEHILYNYKSNLNRHDLLNLQQKLAVLEESISLRKALIGQSYIIRLKDHNSWLYPIYLPSLYANPHFWYKIYGILNNRIEYNRIKLLKIYKTALEAEEIGIDKEMTLVKELTQKTNDIIKQGDQYFWSAYMDHTTILILALEKHVQCVQYIRMIQKSIHDLLKTSDFLTEGEEL